MTDTMELFTLYRRAQKFLGLETDDTIVPEHYETGEASEAERLIADLASVLSEAFPEADADTDNEFRIEACKRWPLDSDARLRGAFIDGANHAFSQSSRLAKEGERG